MNHCKYIMMLIAAVVSVSCNEWQSINQIANSKDSFQAACQNSGGTFRNDLEQSTNHCTCDNVVCESGVICIKSNAPGQTDKLICAGNSAHQYLNCTDGETKCYNGNVYVCVNGVMAYDRKCATNCLSDVCVDECQEVGKVQCGTNPPNAENPNSKYQCVERTLADNKTTIRELKLIETCENGCYESQTGSAGTNCDAAYRDSVETLLVDYLATLSKIQQNACVDSQCKPDYESCLIQRLDLCEERYNLDCKKYQNQVLMENHASDCYKLLPNCGSGDTICLNYDENNEAIKNCCTTVEAVAAIDRFSKCMEHEYECDRKLNDCKTKLDEYDHYGNCNQQLATCKGSCLGLDRDEVEAKYAEAAASCASFKDSCETDCGNKKDSCPDACSEDETQCENNCKIVCMNECLDCGDDCAGDARCQACLAQYQYQIAECRVVCKNTETDVCVPSCETDYNKCKDRCTEQTDTCKIESFVSGLNEGTFGKNKDNPDIPVLSHVDCLTGGNYLDCNVQCTDGDEACNNRKSLCMQERDACRGLLVDQTINRQNREKCMSGAFCGDCDVHSSGNDTVCMLNDFANKGIQYQCRAEDGSWVKMSSSCTGGASCKEKSEINGVNPGDVRSDCGSCINGETECRDEMNGGVMYVCINGEYVVQNSCTDGVSCQFTAKYTAEDTDRRNWQCGKCTNGKNTTVQLPVAMANQRTTYETALYLYRGYYDDLSCRGIVSACSDAQNPDPELQCDRLETCRNEHYIICNRIESMKNCMTEHFANACKIQYIENCMMDSSTSIDACEGYTNIFGAVTDCRNNHSEEACQNYSDDYSSCMTDNEKLYNACLKYTNYDGVIDKCLKEQLADACESLYDSHNVCSISNRPYDFTIQCVDGRYPLDG